MKNASIFLVLLFVIASCKKKEPQNITYFGGEILNPKSNFVLLMQHQHIIDSIPLQANNTFGTYIENIVPGLYYFKHGGEFQYIYLEPLDSINIRLNTWDFDESLVFDGKGAEKNDYLMSVFIKNEREMKNFYSYFRLSEKEFTDKYNYVTQKDAQSFEKFSNSKKNFSPNFLHLVEGASKYHLYRMKELYPYHHLKMKPEDSVVKLSNNFYDFRKNTSLNDSILVDYYAYQNYVSAYLYNDANAQNNYKEIDENFKQILLQSIVDKVQIASLKNMLLYQEIHNYLFRSDNPLQLEFLNLFNENCTDKNMVERINQIVALKSTLSKKDDLKDWMVFDGHHKSKPILDLIKNKPTVLILCYDRNESTEYLIKRIRFLSKNYPDTQFINVNLQDGNLKIFKSGTSPLNQYQLENSLDYKKFATEEIPRTIIMDKNGIVVDNFSLIFDARIELFLKPN